jgi:hypothetical protein
MLIGRAYHRSANLASMVTPLEEWFKPRGSELPACPAMELSGGLVVWEALDKKEK